MMMKTVPQFQGFCLLTFSQVEMDLKIMTYEGHLREFKNRNNRSWEKVSNWPQFSSGLP